MKKRVFKFAVGCAVAGTATLMAVSSFAATLSLPHVAHRLAVKEQLRIVAFGSSSTQGIGATSEAAAYPSVLQHDLAALLRRSGSVVVANRGIGGQDADDMMNRIDADAVNPHPDLVIWQTGSNDPIRHVPLDRFKTETLSAVQKLKAAGVDVMLMEPQWCATLDRTPESVAYRDAVRDIGVQTKIPVIRRSDLMRAWIASRELTAKQLFAPDGLHMADGGYAMLGHEVALEILQNAGVSMETPQANVAASDSKSAAHSETHKMTPAI